MLSKHYNIHQETGLIMPNKDKNKQEELKVKMH